MFALLAACAPAIHEARMSASEPPSERELDAEARVAASPCPHAVHWLFPGIGQACLGKPGDAAVLATLGAGELATGIAIGVDSGFDHPGAALPLLVLQDTWVYSMFDADLDLDR